MRRLFTGYRLRSRKSGFTLTEILVSVTILAIAVAAIYTSFKGGLTSWTVGEARMQRYQNARVALDMISREISAAITITCGTLYLNDFFYGQNDNVTFIAPVRAADDVSDLCTIKYELNSSASQLRRIKESSIDGTITDVITSTGDAKPLASYVTSLDFDYYDSGVGWRDDWDSRTGQAQEGEMPEAVRITMATLDETAEADTQFFTTTVFIPTSRGQ